MSKWTVLQAFIIAFARTLHERVRSKKLNVAQHVVGTCRHLFSLYHIVSLGGVGFWIGFWCLAYLDFVCWTKTGCYEFPRCWGRRDTNQRRLSRRGSVWSQLHLLRGQHRLFWQQSPRGSGKSPTFSLGLPEILSEPSLVQFLDLGKRHSHGTLLSQDPAGKCGLRPDLIRVGLEKLPIARGQSRLAICCLWLTSIPCGLAVSYYWAKGTDTSLVSGLIRTHLKLVTFHENHTQTKQEHLPKWTEYIRTVNNRHLVQKHMPEPLKRWETKRMMFKQQGLVADFPYG